MEISWYFGLLSGIAKVKFRHKAVPLFCHWEVTYKCNLECTFCVTRFDNKAWLPETTTSQALDILSQVAHMGSKILNLVGGEPTRRDDLPQIIKYAHQLDMKVAITTNGVVAGQRRHWLLDADVIRVSLEGAPLLNNRLRQSGGGVDSATEAIKTLEFLSSYRRHPMIACTYSADTRQSDIEFLVGLARRLKIKIVLNPVGIGFSDRRENFTIEDRKERRRRFSDSMLPLADSLKAIAALNRRYSDCILPNEPSFTMLRKGGLEKFGCLAMNTAICLKPDGSIAMPCIEFPETVIKANDLSSVYYGKVAERIRKKQGRYWFCEQCQLTCMISATSLVRLVPLLRIVRGYLPQLLG